jgi:adenylate kinase
MMSRRIVLLGPPGSGKGTQAPLLAKEFGIKHIATGDLLRKVVKNGSEVGQEAQAFLDRGELVPDQVVVEMIRQQLVSLNGDGGFVLDGFPRSMSQAEALKGITDIDFAVLIDVPKEEVINRLSARRVCQDCGQIYHLEFKPPKEDGICDVCGGRLEQRSDDKPDVVEKRYEVQYNELAVPLIESYRKDSNLLEIDGRGSIEEVFERILNEIRVRSAE